MKKMSKGALAAAAAALLLVGGAGTIAFWNDSETVDAGTITAGELALEPGEAAATWTDTTTDTPIDDIGDFLVVPGDNLVYEATFVVTAQGDNLEATLEVDESSITGDLPAESTMTVEVLGADGPLSAITEANDGETITAQITFDFPYEEATNDSQTTDVDLSGLVLTLEQTPVA